MVDSLRKLEGTNMYHTNSEKIFVKKKKKLPMIKHEFITLTQKSQTGQSNGNISTHYHHTRLESNHRVGKERLKDFLFQSRMILMSGILCRGVQEL